MLDNDPELEKLITSAEGIPKCLKEHGVAILRGVLSPAQCEAGLAGILQHHANAEAEVGETDIEQKWFSQRYRCRDDVLLTYDVPSVTENLSSILGVLTSPLIELLGEEAMCTELAAHISQPGARENSWHRDHSWTHARKVVTCFTALQDIPHDLGPTEVCLGTHEMPGNVEEVLSSSSGSSQYTQLRLRRGDIALMDARLIHRGGARSETRRDGCPIHRVLFYVTWRDWSCSVHNDDYTPSLLPEYVDRLPLKDSAIWCKTGPMARRLPYCMALWEAGNARVASCGTSALPVHCMEGQDFFNDDFDIDDMPEDAEAMAAAARGIKAI